MAIRVVLADDHRLFREGLRAMLEKEADMDVVGESEDGRTAVQQVNELKPDLVVMDVSMRGLNGIEAARQITHQMPDTKILALSMYSDRRFGEGFKEVAKRLNISVKTVETHRQQIMNRLNVHNVADLTKFAIREGLTSLEP